jgi:hypothetical protein
LSPLLIAVRRPQLAQCHLGQSIPMCIPGRPAPGPVLRRP